MDLFHFFKILQDSPRLRGISVIFFYVPMNSTFFISLMYRSIKVRVPKEIIIIDSSDGNFENMHKQLEVSFLGSSLIYIIHNLHMIHPASKKKWLSYITEYKGPHILIFFDTEHVELIPNNSYTIKIPHNVIPAVYNKLYALFYPHSLIDSSFVNTIFKHFSTFSLDTACMLMGYQATLGKNIDIFFKEWFKKLVTPERSLFTLSQYFFAQQYKEFLIYWEQYQINYPEEFWISFWAEQLWQATLFINRAHQQGINEASKLAFRLPFSFINKDWQRYTLLFLSNAHQHLYMIDFTMKNSPTSHGLELWYHKFFLQQF